MDRIPPQVGTSIVHGDYRLDNCMVSGDGRIAAVLDWEICTLGDAMADVGLLMVYWTGPKDAEGGLASTATAVEGFPDRLDLLERYAKVSGRDVADVDFYTAFAVLEARVHRRRRVRALRRRSDGLGPRRLRDVQAPGRTFRGHGGRDRGSRVVSPAEPAALYEIHSRPDLDVPVLVVALEGWIDAGLGAATAAQALVADLEPAVIATFDSDRLLDYRAPAGDASPRWREHRADVARHPAPPREGPCWEGPVAAARARARRTVEAIHRAISRARPSTSGRCLVVGLGAYPFAAPHTRPSRLSTTANSSDLAERLGYLRNSVDVPAGVEAAIERRCAEVGLPAVGLWAQVPHYAAAMPYPPASIALIDGLSEVGELSLKADGLRQAAAAHVSRLDELVAQSDEHREMLHQLELQADAETAESAGSSFAPLNAGDLPTGDDLVAELERFLREQG